MMTVAEFKIQNALGSLSNGHKRQLLHGYGTAQEIKDTLQAELDSGESWNMITVTGRFKFHGLSIVSAKIDHGLFIWG